MRSRSRRKSRSPISLDLRTLYVDGFVAGVLSPIDRPVPNAVDFEVEFCEQILKVYPNHIEALALLGEAYSRRGDYARGLAADLRLSQIRPDSEYVQYNLACSYALNGQRNEALLALAKAADLGYHDIEHLRTDRDLEILKDDPRFAVLIEKMSTSTQEADHV